MSRPHHWLGIWLWFSFPWWFCVCVYLCQQATKNQSVLKEWARFLSLRPSQTFTKTKSMKYRPREQDNMGHVCVAFLIPSSKCDFPTKNCHKNCVKSHIRYFCCDKPWRSEQSESDSSVENNPWSFSALTQLLLRSGEIIETYPVVTSRSGSQWWESRGGKAAAPESFIIVGFWHMVISTAH